MSFILDNDALFWRAVRARTRAHANLNKLGMDDINYNYLSLFLRGGLPGFDIMNDMTEEDTKKLELLSGEHGLTILKIGLLRQGVSLKLRAK